MSINTWGGVRENSGRKSTWSHPETKTVRIPAIFADMVLDYANHLDKGSEPLTGLTVADLESIAALLLSDKQVTRNGKDTGAVKRAISAYQKVLISGYVCHRAS